MIRDTEEKQL